MSRAIKTNISISAKRPKSLRFKAHGNMKRTSTSNIRKIIPTRKNLTLKPSKESL
jgi:ribosomal protein L34